MGGAVARAPVAIDGARELEAVAVHLERRRSREAPAAEEDVHAEPGEAPRAVDRCEAGAEPSHARHHGGEVDVDRGHVHAEGAGLARVGGGARRGDDRLRRHAADVQAVAAEDVALDERHARAEPGGARRRDEAGGARADDDEVVPAGGRGVSPGRRPDLGDERPVVLVVGEEARRRVGAHRRRHHGLRLWAESTDDESGAASQP